MKPGRRIFLRALAAYSLLSLAACQRNAQGFSKDKIVQKYPMTTHSVGRFLIDLPKAAKDVQTSLKIIGKKIEWKASSEAQYNVLLAKRTRELKGANANDQLLVKAAAGETPKTMIVLFEEDASRDGFIAYEGYRYYDMMQGYFVVTGSAARKNIEHIVPAVQRILNLVQPHNPDKNETIRGVLVDHAFVSGVDPQLYEYAVLSANVGEISIAFSTRVVDRSSEDDSPLERADLLKNFPGTKILRKSKRAVAGLNGDEVGFLDRPQPNAKVKFVWEYPGQPHSLTAPVMSVAIESTEPVSMPEDELLGLWDAVLDSIRLRPGAV